jgi:hypothetical protein
MASVATGLMVLTIEFLSSCRVSSRSFNQSVKPPRRRTASERKEGTKIYRSGSVVKKSHGQEQAVISKRHTDSSITSQSKLRTPSTRTLQFAGPRTVHPSS